MILLCIQHLPTILDSKMTGNGHSSIGQIAVNTKRFDKSHRKSGQRHRKELWIKLENGIANIEKNI